MKKKVLAVLCILALLCGTFCGCGGSGDFNADTPDYDAGYAETSADVVENAADNAAPAQDVYAYNYGNVRSNVIDNGQNNQIHVQNNFGGNTATTGAPATTAASDYAQSGYAQSGYAQSSYGTSDGSVGLIPIACPLCNGGANLQVCPVCLGDGKVQTKTDSSNCIACNAFKEGYLTCPLCENNNNFTIGIRTDANAQQIAADIAAVGQEPLINSLCPYCAGGTSLTQCGKCGGKGYTNSFSGGFSSRVRCSECDNGYIKCAYCRNGLIKNTNYSAEHGAWKEKIVAIKYGVVVSARTPEEEARLEAYNNAQRVLIDSMDAGNSSLGNYGGSYGSAYSGRSNRCVHCAGTGKCSRCYGDHLMHNGYTGNNQPCSSCSYGECPFCGGSGSR